MKIYITNGTPSITYKFAFLAHLSCWLKWAFLIEICLLSAIVIVIIIVIETSPFLEPRHKVWYQVKGIQVWSLFK